MLEFFLAFIIACSYPHEKDVYPLGIDSSIFLFSPLYYVSFFFDNGYILGIIIAATIPAILTVK